MLPVFWTTYTTRAEGRVVKFVPCENCSVEYVYLLERESEGVGTSLYLLNEEGAENESKSSAVESLEAYLENDFDPVPCPVCGHYQRFMFPKLITTGLFGPLVRLFVLVMGVFAAVYAVYLSVMRVQQPNAFNQENMIAAWIAFTVLFLIECGLALLERHRVRHFDPNIEDPQKRIAIGRSRAVSRVQFEETLQQERLKAGIQNTEHDPAGADPKPKSV